VEFTLTIQVAPSASSQLSRNSSGDLSLVPSSDQRPCRP
jgi:hypothetical protein